MVYGRIAGPRRRSRTYRRPRAGISVAPEILSRALPFALRQAGLYRDRGRSVPRKSRVSMQRRRSQPARLPVRTRGTYAGRFRKPRKVKTNKFERSCFSITHEKGGTVNDPDCGYIGHGVAVDRMFDSVCQHIVMKLFRKAGFVINSMEKKINELETATITDFDYEIMFYWRAQNHDVLSQASQIIDGDSTYMHAGSLLASKIRSEISPSTEEFECHSIQLRQVNAPSRNIVLSKLLLQHYMLDMRCKSSLNVQNQTVGLALGDDSVTDVTNNPLEGFSYTGRGNGLRFGSSTLALNLDISNGFLASQYTGVMTFATNGTNVDSGTKALFRRPPGVSAFQGCSKRARVRVAPGNIKRSVITCAKKMLFNDFVTMLLTDMRSNDDDVWIDFGKSELIALEKLCRTGAEGGNISLGYELNQHYKVNGWQKIVKMAPSHIVYA